MHRFFDYFKRYNIIDKELQRFLFQHGRIRHYSTKDLYPDPEQPVWCFIIEGAVALEYDTSGKIVIDRVHTRYDYFTTTEHIFTRRLEKGLYIFLQDSILYEISNQNLQRALAAYPPMETLFNIFKQHQLDLIKHLARVLKLGGIKRIHYMDKHLPQVLHILTVTQRCSLLNISNLREYYKALRYRG